MKTWLKRVLDGLFKVVTLAVAVVVFLVPFVILMLAGLGAMLVLRWVFDR